MGGHTITAKTHGCPDKKFRNGLHVGADGHVITKISRIYSLPFFLTHGSPLRALI